MNYPKILEKTCKNCHKNIIAKRSRDLKKDFCSPGCVGKFLLSKPEELVKCKLCSKEFKKTSKTKNVFCSKKCSNASKIKIHKRICKTCKKEFILKNIAYEKKNRGVVCSRECNRRFTCDQDYFKIINSEEKAYWLGFLWADGNIYKSTMTLKIHNKDIKHLENFKLAINNTSSINKIVNCSELRIYNKTFCQNLIDLGMLPNKSLKVEFPEISEVFFRHFIRGVFDGDGCMYTKGYSKIWSIFTGSENFHDKLKSIIESKTKVKVYTYKQKGGFALRIYKKSDLKKIKNFFYFNANIFLERKLKKLEEAIKD